MEQMVSVSWLDQKAAVWAWDAVSRRAVSGWSRSAAEGDLHGDVYNKD